MMLWKRELKIKKEEVVAFLIPLQIVFNQRYKGNY
jgi:hypothetical protein